MRFGALAVGLVGVAVLPAALLPRDGVGPDRTGPANPPVIATADQGPAADLIAWTIDSRPGEAFRAVLKSSVMSVAPYFDAVRLEQGVGAAAINCGAFAQPVLTDTGAHRYWNYTMARPTAGPCAGGSYVAVGSRGGVEFRTEAVP